MHRVTTGRAGALAVLALGLFAEAAAADVFTAALPPAPSDYVNDTAQMLAPAARERLEKRFGAFRDRYAFVRIYAYTLRSANGAAPAEAAQELYRRWKMKDRELYDGLATIFVFWEEKKALVMLGQGAPESTEEALGEISADLSAVFGDDPEGALGRVLDRIGASLEKAPSTSWLDSPPVPEKPSGPLHGNPHLAIPGEVAMLEEAARKADTPEHPFTLVMDPAKGLDSAEQRAAKLAAAWPERIVLVASRSDFFASLAVPSALAGKFPEDQRQRIVREIRAAATNATYATTLARVVSEVASLAEGKAPAPWVAWKHPLKFLGGGQDETPVPLVVGIAVALAALGALGWFLYALWTDPKSVLLGIAGAVLQGVIGGAFSGGSRGSSGGGYSGGGGSFGGGGASGSW